MAKDVTGGDDRARHDAVHRREPWRNFEADDYASLE